MAVATAFSAEMALITGNAGGAIQSLPAVSVVGGRARKIVATIPLASQASGVVIGIARIPKAAIITEIVAVTDTSLGSSTIAIGDANNGAIYVAAVTLTATQTRTFLGPLVNQTGVALASNLYDSVTGLATNNYEDLVLTVAAAALPASGTLKLITEYVLD